MQERDPVAGAQQGEQIRDGSSGRPWPRPRAGESCPGDGKERALRQSERARADGEIDPDRVVFQPVDQSRWPDFVRLFESRGGPKHCWCMVWRGTTREKAEQARRKAAMEHRVASGVPVGLLGYLDDEPVAWCSIAPRSTYRPLGGVEDPNESEESVWSLVCFFVTRRLRGEGMMRRLLAAAIEHARGRGATVLEAYPVDPDSPSYRFMGFVASFEALGFREVGRTGTRRHVVRLVLT